MPASYPDAIKEFTPKEDGVDIILAAHINELQEEITAIQQTLGVNPNMTPGKFAIIDINDVPTGSSYETEVYTGLEWVRAGFIEGYVPDLVDVTMAFGTLVDGEPSFETGAYPGGLEGCAGTSEASIAKFGPLGQCAKWSFSNHLEHPSSFRIMLFGVESAETELEVL